jgi:hypothetical protein
MCLAAASGFKAEVELPGRLGLQRVALAYVFIRPLDPERGTLAG